MSAILWPRGRQEDNGNFILRLLELRSPRRGAINDGLKRL
jgi:hypothetical protein